MGPLGVVGPEPGGGLLAHLGEGTEDAGVEDLAPIGPVEAWDRPLLGSRLLRLGGGETGNWHRAGGLAPSNQGSGPEGWRLPVQLGINLVVEHTRPAFAERENAVEVVPVHPKSSDICSSRGSRCTWAMTSLGTPGSGSGSLTRPTVSS